MVRLLLARLVPVGRSIFKAVQMCDDTQSLDAGRNQFHHLTSDSTSDEIDSQQMVCSECIVLPLSPCTQALVKDNVAVHTGPCCVVLTKTTKNCGAPVYTLVRTPLV